MLKRIFVCFLFFSFGHKLIAGQPLTKSDSLVNIFHVKEQRLRDKQLIDYFQYRFLGMPLTSLDSSKSYYKKLLSKYNVENKEAFENFIESVCLERLKHRDESINAMIKAIDFAGKNQDHYLSYTFLNYLAYSQTEEGNATGAVSSYRLAKKEAAKLNDDYMQLVIDVNISDVYYKNNFYSQSLFYLDQAQAICTTSAQKDGKMKTQLPRLQLTIYYNKCENFFRMKEADSLKKYNGEISKLKIKSKKSYTYKNRTAYYLFLLNHDYASAVKLINAMQKDSLFKFSNLDKQNRADAYYENGEIDSAVSCINNLLADPSEKNHPEIKFHQYEILGEIAEKKSDHELAALNYKLALQQAKEYNATLTQVGNISSLIKIDDIESAHNQIDEQFEQERLWLIFGIGAALFTIAFIAIIYRNVKQKRHYENLLYAAKKEELAFINSHEVRKHLTNILGLVEVIRNSADKESEYLQAEDHLFNSAEQLDKAIKNISEKIDE